MKQLSFEEYLKILRSDPTHTSLLKQVPAPDRKKVINTVEHITQSLFESLALVMGEMNSNPDVLQEIEEALKDGNGIIKESDGSPISLVDELKEKK